MTDTDLIARIYPVLNNEAGHQFLKENPDRLLPALRLPNAPVAALDRGERESTQPLDDRLNNVDDYLDCLELRFSNPPRTGRGFVFGRDEKCDVVLPANLTNISNYHFNLTFESDFEDTHMYRLVLRDLRSRSGTSVEYNGKGGGRRRDFRWILSGHSETLNTPIIIEPHHMLLLRIEVFVPRISGHLDDWVRYLLRQRSPESLFDDLKLDNPPHTQVPTGVQSPNSGPILIDTAEFGRGAFAVVYRCWNVSTGRLFARKQSRSPLSEGDRASWRREAKLLARLSHVREISFVFLSFR
jgi:serine/threonine-protein kinase Chk2